DKNGKFNLPEIKAKKHRSVRGTEFSFTTQEGTPWQVIIQDWVLKNGTFAFRDFGSNQSHSLNGFNLRFYNLEFNENTPFDLNFILRNKIKDKIVEAETFAKGAINFANFKPKEMSLTDVEAELYALKSPVKLKLNATNFVEPDLDLKVQLPEVTENDISFLFDLKDTYSLPYTELSLKGSAKDNFNNFDISSLAIKNRDVELTAKANLVITSGTLNGDISVTKSKINASKIASYYKPLKPFALVGSLDAGGKFYFENSVFKTKKLNLKTNSISSKIFNFTVQNANIAFEATENFNKMSAVVQDGTFLVGRQKISSIKGNTALDYKKQDFYAIIESGLLNGKETKMSVAIANVRQEDKRKVKMLLSTIELNPLEIFDLVEDFAQALVPDRQKDWQEDTSDLAWLRNFRSDLPSFMRNFKGSVYAKKFTSPVLSGQDFYGKFDFTGLLPQMKNLDGSISATLSNGIIYKLQEAADNQKVLGIAYQPFVIMSRMERAGSFKMGKILKDTPFEIMSASVNFKNGNMTVNNAYVDGSVISAAIGGNVDWVKEHFNLDIVTMFKNTSKRGALSENLTDESGAPALAFVTYGSMSKPKLEMKSPKKVGKQIQAAREKEVLDFSEINKFKQDYKE
ncbi:MAG: hypothetical protein II183_00020, partial [Elusimicrobiaceae bacterium]|nr:hypothetical protein [Elusimicrobiaceae bacterium]